MTRSDVQALIDSSFRSVRDPLAHLHAAEWIWYRRYHRGQVTTMLRQLGATPPKVMDLIAFYRERTTPAA